MSAKACTKCNQVKSLDEFGPDRRRADGKKARCRPCLSADEMQRYKANPEPVIQRISETRRKWDRSRAQAVWKEQNRRRREGVEKLVVTERELRDLRSRPCVLCNSTDNVEADHIVPIARGGRHSIGNLQPLCRKCNRAKASMLWAEFRYAQ